MTEDWRICARDGDGACTCIGQALQAIGVLWSEREGTHHPSLVGDDAGPVCALILSKALLSLWDIYVVGQIVHCEVHGKQSSRDHVDATVLHLCSCIAWLPL